MTVYGGKRAKRRWGWSIASASVGALISVGSLILGIVVGAASASDDSNECGALSEDLASLVSEGLDAGLSGDEAAMLEVADRREHLRSEINKKC